MSMNILVQTQVQSAKDFELHNPILAPGEIAIDNEGLSTSGDGNIATGVKIGNGVDYWADLEYLPNLTEEIVEKWLTIATSVSDSKLVMLPDLNFAYTILDASKNNWLIKDILERLLQDNHYIDLGINEDQEQEYLTYQSTTGNVINICKNSNLIFGSSEALGMYLRSTTTGENIELPYLIFQDKIDNEELKVSFVDLQARISSLNLTDLLYSHVKDMTEKFNNVNAAIEDILNNKIQHFSVLNDGIVKKPSKEQEQMGYFLRADNSWAKVAVSGDEIPLNKDTTETVYEAVVRLTSSDDSLYSNKITNTETPYYVASLPITDTSVEGSSISNLVYSDSIYIQGNVLYGAAWNDYAECRITNNITPGRVVVENGDDTLSLSTERLMLGGNIVSDTFGMLIGETEKAKTPIALCGRVLAYPFEDRSEYYAGAPVCTGPNGTVSIMSKDEVLHYPECIIGYVSAVPEYTNWRGKEVDGRIWIKVI